MAAGLADTVCRRPPLALTFDRLTLKMVCESHLRWGTFLLTFGTLGLWVLELFAMYATDGRIKASLKIIPVLYKPAYRLPQGTGGGVQVV